MQATPHPPRRCSRRVRQAPSLLDRLQRAMLEVDSRANQRRLLRCLRGRVAFMRHPDNGVAETESVKNFCR